MGSAVTITALLVIRSWTDTMAKYIVPAGSDVVATWSIHSSNLTFKHTTKEAIFDESDIDIHCSQEQSLQFGYEVLAFNLPQPNTRKMKRIGFKLSQVLRKE